MDSCISCHKPRAIITIDEKLFPTKARCRFTQNMLKKPDKFDIKFWFAVDVETKYILNAIPYVGKHKTRVPLHRLSYWAVMNLMEPYVGKEEMMQLTISLPRKAWPSNCGRRRQA